MLLYIELSSLYARVVYQVETSEGTTRHEEEFSLKIVHFGAFSFLSDKGGCSDRDMSPSPLPNTTAVR